MSDIVMPKLSDTMTEGRVVSWKKRVGETVRRGDVLAEVETDKANMELESFAAGVLLEIRVQAGEMADVGTVIAVVGKAEEKGAEQPAKPEPQPREPEPQPAPQQAQPGQGAAGAAPPAGEAEVKSTAGKPGGVGEQQAPAAPVAEAGETQAPAEPGAEGEAPAAQAPRGRAEARPAAPSGPPAAAPGEGATRERAAPVVRRKAREMGVDLSQVKGSGPEGRILLEDLEGHGVPPGEAPPREVKREEGGRPAEQPPAEGEVKAMPRLRAAVAKIVTESWHTIPHFTVTMEIVMDDAESMRRQLKQLGKAVTVNDMIVKGVALALQKFPNLNASFAPEGMRLHSDVNVGVAVGVPDGVLVPVVMGCHKRSLLDIAAETRRLVEKARGGGLNEQDMSGGTFSVSNMGMYGVHQFSAIIYPNQSGVLAVGAVVETAVTCAGQMGTRKIMRVTLSADHRLVDGAYAAQFLVEFKAIMESPVRLLL